MPLTAYERKGRWWIRGRVELDGRPVTGYIRRSARASSEKDAAREADRLETALRRRAILGHEAPELTFADAVLLYAPKPKDAGYLARLVPDLGAHALSAITRPVLVELARRLYPKASTDTWKRQVLTPVAAVINNAHRTGKAAPVQFGGFSTQERTDQDAERGKQSRPDKVPGDWRWIDQ
ncbi:MAG: integrase, partial [Pseudomonadota bacterium]